MARLVFLAAACGLLGCAEEGPALLEAGIGQVDRNCIQLMTSRGWAIRSLRVAVVDIDSGQLGELIEGECIQDIEELVVRFPGEILSWFEGRGYIARGMPVDSASKVQIIGYQNEACVHSTEPLGPIVCAISEEVISGATYDAGDTVELDFACPSMEPQANGMFTQCIRGEL